MRFPNLAAAAAVLTIATACGGPGDLFGASAGAHAGRSAGTTAESLKSATPDVSPAGGGVGAGGSRGSAVVSPGSAGGGSQPLASPSPLPSGAPSPTADYMKGLPYMRASTCQEATVNTDCHTQYQGQYGLASQPRGNVVVTVVEDGRDVLDTVSFAISQGGSRFTAELYYVIKPGGQSLTFQATVKDSSGRVLAASQPYPQTVINT